MLLQTLYFFVDLYFVAELGGAAVAGVSAAGNVTLIFFALTQVLGIGTVTLISHAIGRRDHQDANLIFNQSLLLAGLSGVVALIVGYTLSVPYLRLVAADEAMVMQGRDYLYWFLPGMALQFAMVSMISALRGMGNVKPAIIVQTATVLFNIVLTPVLIAGWGAGHPMGVAGAGLASSIAVLGGVALLWLYFNRVERYISFHPHQWRPRFYVWSRTLKIGLPAGGELLLIFGYTSITFLAISDFGPSAQAGFAIASRVMHGIFLPALAIAVVVAPVAGQNFGARQLGRVRETFRVASLQSIGIMFAAMLLCQWQAEAMVRFFSPDGVAVRVGTQYLQLISWTFAFSGMTLVCSGVFQALGNTLPSLVSSVMHLLVYGVSATWLTSQSEYKLEHVWYVSIAGTVLQAALIGAWLRKHLRLWLGSSTSPQPA